MDALPKMIQVTNTSKVLLINAPEYYGEAVRQASKHVDTAVNKLVDIEYDFIQIFYINKEEMACDFPTYKEYLAKNGKLWVSWPKARKLNTDLSLDAVIKIGYSNGLVESNNIRIDDIWTALKFTWPKPGKIYNNSHATLVL